MHLACDLDLPFGVGLRKLSSERVIHMTEKGLTLCSASAGPAEKEQLPTKRASMIAAL